MDTKQREPVQEIKRGINFARLVTNIVIYPNVENVVKATILPLTDRAIQALDHVKIKDKTSSLANNFHITLSKWSDSTDKCKAVALLPGMEALKSTAAFILSGAVDLKPADAVLK